MHLSQNWHIHYVHLSQNLHIHYVQISPAFSKSKIIRCFDFHFLALVVAPGHYQGDVAVLDKSTPQELAPVAVVGQSCGN